MKTRVAPSSQGDRGHTRGWCRSPRGSGFRTRHRPADLRTVPLRGPVLTSLSVPRYVGDSSRVICGVCLLRAPPPLPCGEQPRGWGTRSGCPAPSLGAPWPWGAILATPAWASSLECLGSLCPAARRNVCARTSSVSPSCVRPKPSLAGSP